MITRCGLVRAVQFHRGGAAGTAAAASITAAASGRPAATRTRHAARDPRRHRRPVQAAALGMERLHRIVVRMRPSAPARPVQRARDSPAGWCPPPGGSHKNPGQLRPPRRLQVPEVGPRRIDGRPVRIDQPAGLPPVAGGNELPADGDAPSAAASPAETWRPPRSGRYGCMGVKGSRLRILPSRRFFEHTHPEMGTESAVLVPIGPSGRRRSWSSQSSSFYSRSWPPACRYSRRPHSKGHPWPTATPA
jgi:hypothetical protein